MTKIITTQNSTYEVDECNQRFRLVESRRDPTPNFVDAGEWHNGVMVRWGNRALFHFASGHDTISSPIIDDSPHRRGCSRD